MSLTALTITQDNRAPFDALSVGVEQAHLIARNDGWLDLALTVPETHNVGLLEGENPVGLYSLTDTRGIPGIVLAQHFQQDCSYLWHFMLDAAAQGRGLGRAALGVVEDHASRCDASGLSLTTGDHKPGNALPFYRAAGYVPTGRRIEGEIELVKHFARPFDA